MFRTKTVSINCVLGKFAIVSTIKEHTTVTQFLNLFII